MESKPRSTPSSIARSPLTERRPRAAPSSVGSRTSARSKLTSSPRLPHHESVRPEGNLSVISRRTPPSQRYANKRAVAIYEDEVEASRRDSQISTTSTLSNGAGKRKTHIGPWQLGKTLGKGATGRVRLAKHTMTGERAAIKIVSKKSAALVASSSMRRMDGNAEILSNIAGVRTMPFGIEREIVIMKLIEHPNLITLYDIWENRGELYLVMEYVEGGELFSYITRNERLPEVEAVRLLRQLLAGLAYCHRFNICHRDLKPENILLDADHNIKIADFGMAALQPLGETLSTACGSPHYAAPEICAGKEYDGSKVDTWSAGIIFYAMLCGFLPFDGQETGQVMAKIKKGEYYIPEALSAEATDLIQRMLQNNPKRRISMSQIWDHPVMRKHERTLRASLPAGSQLPGPPPELTVADCGPRRIRPEDIDRSLLRNLQILWHGLKESDVVARLTNDEPNYEKLFYWALIRFQEEQQENYPGESLHYSNSDYHHVRPIKPRLVQSRSKATLQQRRNSQFSIVSEDTLPRNPHYRNPQITASKATQSSYDPYRASRKAVAGSLKGTTVVVKRPGSRVSHRHERHSSIASSHMPEVPSLDTPEMQRILSKQKAAFAKVDSQGSMASSQRRPVFRKSSSYRRNVIFAHQRLAAGSACDSPPETPRASTARPGTRESCQTFSDSRSTPSMPTPHRVARPRKTASDLDLSTMRGHRLWRDDTRQVSAELSKICEEAFNRSSLSCASDFSQQANQRGTWDSPATTVSVPEAILAQFEKNAALTPALQDLLLRRQRMIDTWGDGDPQTLTDLLDTVDRKILAERQYVSFATDKRVVSDPIHNRMDSGFDHYSRYDTMRNLNENRTSARAVTDPLSARNNTIRLVSPESTPPSRSAVRPSKAMPINSLAGSALPLERRRESYDNRLVAGHQLDPIMEDPPPSPRKQLVNGKKRTWFSKKAMSSYDDLPPTPPRKDTPKVPKFQDMSNESTSTVNTRSDGSASDDVDAKKRSWFRKVFNKRRNDKTLSIDNDHKVVPDAGADDTGLQELFTPARSAGRRNHVRGSSMEAGSVSSRIVLPAEQSWFAKILHLKPATTVLVMTTTKAQARKEIVKVLREWRKFGIKDVAVEKRDTGDVIRARVDAVNYLRIRPVQFTASIYTVLERGRPANLALAKFTQERGAASSFHRVLGTIESVLTENNLMLDDPIKRKKITKSMKQAGL